MKYPIEITDREELLCYLPKNGIVAELGVFMGEYSNSIFEYSTPSHLYLVDLWEDAVPPWPNKDSSRLCHKVVSLIFKDNPKVTVVKEDAVKFLQEKPDRFFDWVYIDLDHTYEGTKEILELSESKVKSEGFIAGHDYTANESFGVIQAVDEFCIKRNWTIKYLTTEQHKYFSYILSKGTT